MKDPAARLRALLLELKRRKVTRVALAYAVAAWLLTQIAATTFPVLQLPVWTVTFVVVALLLGFPIALLLSWAYDLTPDGAGWNLSPGAPHRETSDGESSEHDAPAPVRAGAVSRQAIRPLPPLYPAGRIVGSLPPQSTPFVGRTTELRRIGHLLEDEDTRLINICGPAGMGKTRFAIEATRRNGGRYPDGFHFVPLAGVGSTELLISAIAESLEIPIGSREQSKLQLLDCLRGRRALLVLDNFEQLSDSGVLLSEILDQAPGVTLLVTSMQRLDLRREVLFPLEGLHLPYPSSSDDAEAADAVQLFLQSARRTDAAFDPTAEELRDIVRICALVEGIPLAIELASAWTRLLTCVEIVREIQRDHDFLSSTLRDVPERHRSLRAAFESSWRLLSDAERRVFRRTAVFRGGFSREAAEQVAGASMPLLSNLLDKSLVRRASAGRFEVIEILRQYAEDKLREDPEEVKLIREHHAAFFIGLLEAVSKEGTQPSGGIRSGEPIERLAVDADNLRNAWANAAERCDTDQLRSGIDGIFSLHDARSWSQDGERLIATALATLENSQAQRTDGAASDPGLLAKLRVRQGVFCFRLGHHDKGHELIERGLAELQELEEQREVAFALDALGLIACSRGDYSRAKSLHSEGLEIFRVLGNRMQVARTLSHLGNVAFATGAYGDARELYGEGLDALREIGEKSEMWAPLCNLGIIAAHEGEFPKADKYFREALKVARELNKLRGVANSLQNLGYACYLTGRYTEAEEYLAEATSISRAIGNPALLAFCLNARANIASARNEIDRAWQMYRQALKTASEVNEPPLMLEILIGVARLIERRDSQPERAAEILAMVLQHPASDQSARDSATTLLGELEERTESSLQVAIDQGRTLDLHTTVAELLALRPTILST
jgi:predicted ATPase